MRKKWYKRTTFVVTMWSMVLLTYIVIRDLSSPFLTSLTPILGAIILAYVGGEKLTDYRHGPEVEPQRKDE